MTTDREELVEVDVYKFEPRWLGLLMHEGEDALVTDGSCWYGVTTIAETKLVDPDKWEIATPHGWLPVDESAAALDDALPDTPCVVRRL